MSRCWPSCLPIVSPCQWLRSLWCLRHPARSREEASELADDSLNPDAASDALEPPCLAPSNQESVDSESAVCCRLCLEVEDSPGELVSPCVCRGSAKYVHVRCAEAAFAARAASSALHWLEICCPICKHAYEGEIAVQLGAIAVQELTRLFGSGSIEVASALHNLGIAYGRIGDSKREEELLEQALAQQESHLGINHMQVASTLINLGNVCSRRGKIAKQHALLKRALVIAQSENHIHTVAAILVNLGTVYGMMGQPAQQRDALEHALPMLELEFGRSHHTVATALVNLGIAYGALGHAERQKELLERALAIREKEFGPDHRAVATTLVNLGNTFGRLGDVHQQKKLLERALEIKRRAFGPDHVEVANSLVILGTALGDLGDITKQKSMLEHALSIQEAHFGPESREVLSALGGLSLVHGKLGDLETKRRLLERVLSIMEDEFGPDHCHVAVTLQELANTCGELGDLEAEQSHMARARSVEEGGATARFHGEGSPGQLQQWEVSCGTTARFHSEGSNADQGATSAQQWCRQALILAGANIVEDSLGHQQVAQEEEHVAPLESLLSRVLQGVLKCRCKHRARRCAGLASRPQSHRSS